jgi:fermentation-respiration switch protein FrsA (DUF1100 family)
MMHLVFQFLAAAAAVYALLVGMLFIGQRALMYQPGHDRGTPSEAGLPEAREVRVETPDGLVLAAWFVAPKDDRPVVLYFHGNAGTIRGRAFKAELLAGQGIGTFLAEYRGYGGNPGKPSEAAFYGDAEACVAWLAAQGIGPARIVVYGESLGTGVAVETAARLARRGTPVRGIVLEAPFTSMADAAGYHYPWVPTGLLTRDRYDSAAKIGEIGAPLLVVHGAADRTVPQVQGRRLFELAGQPKQGFWPPGAGHTDLYDHGVGGAVIGFIEGLNGV